MCPRLDPDARIRRHLNDKVHPISKNFRWQIGKAINRLGSLTSLIAGSVFLTFALMPPANKHIFEHTFVSHNLLGFVRWYCNLDRIYNPIKANKPTIATIYGLLFLLLFAIQSPILIYAQPEMTNKVISIDALWASTK